MAITGATTWPASLLPMGPHVQAEHLSSRPLFTICTGSLPEGYQSPTSILPFPLPGPTLAATATTWPCHGLNIKEGAAAPWDSPWPTSQTQNKKREVRDGTPDPRYQNVPHVNFFKIYFSINLKNSYPPRGDGTPKKISNQKSSRGLSLLRETSAFHRPPALPRWGNPFAGRGGAVMALRAVDLPCLVEGLGRSSGCRCSRRARSARERAKVPRADFLMPAALSRYDRPGNFSIFREDSQLSPICKCSIYERYGKISGRASSGKQVRHG